MSQAYALTCPSCTASLNHDGQSETVRCEFCNTTIIVPESLREVRTTPGIMGEQEPDKADKIHEVLVQVQTGNKVQAIKVYRQTFGVPLKEAKVIVDQLASGQPTAVTTSSSGASCLVSLVIFLALFGLGIAGFFVANGNSVAELWARISEGDFEGIARSIESSVAASNRQASNSVIVTTSGGDNASPEFLMEYMRFGGEEIPILISYTAVEDGRRSILWEVQVAESGSIQDFQVGFDAQHIYISQKTTFAAYDKETGEVVWDAELSDQVLKQCSGCIQTINKTVVALTADQTLYGLDAKTGDIAWQMTLARTSLSGGKDGYMPFANLNGMVAIVDDVEVDGRPREALMLFDAGSGELVHQLTPRCPDIDNFFDDAFLSNNAHIFVQQSRGELYFLFGSSINGPFCIQQWDPETGNTLWENRFPADTELAHELGTGIITEQSSSPNLVFGDGVLLLSVNTAESDNDIMQIDLTTGEATFLFSDDDFDLFPIGRQKDMIISRAHRNRGTERVEIWGINTATGERVWTHALDAMDLLDVDPIGDWTYHLTPSGLVLVQLSSDPDQVRVQSLDIVNGEMQYETETAVADDYWSGVTWTDETAYMTLRTLYAIDLESGEMVVEWP